MRIALRESRSSRRRSSASDSSSAAALEAGLAARRARERLEEHPARRLGNDDGLVGMGPRDRDLAGQEVMLCRSEMVMRPAGS